MRAALVIIALLATGAARAQTPAPAPAPAASHTHAKPKKPAAKPAKPPVVAPKHGATPRKPVHPKAKLSNPKTKLAPAPTDVPPEKKAPPPKAVAKPAPPPRPVIPADEGTVTHLHLPRYVSLRSDEVNMRAGPANRFPILWVYKRKELPVKIEREFDIWRLVEDMDGVKGWIHQATITGRRTFVVTGTQPQTLRAEGADTGEAVAILKPGVVGRIKTCDANAAWCRVEAGGYSGWLPRSGFWGTDPGEAVVP